VAELNELIDKGMTEAACGAGQDDDRVGVDGMRTSPGTDRRFWPTANGYELKAVLLKKAF